MTFKAYSIVPIDFGWDLLPTVEEHIVRLRKEEDEAAEVGEAGTGHHSASVEADYAEAMSLASDAGWEGETASHGRPRVFFVPGDGRFDYGFVWKQPNNGTTFVVAPYPLPWLDDL